MCVFPTKSQVTNQKWFLHFIEPCYFAFQLVIYFDYHGSSSLTARRMILLPKLNCNDEFLLCDVNFLPVRNLFFFQMATFCEANASTCDFFFDAQRLAVTTINSLNLLAQSESYQRYILTFHLYQPVQ
jgi:hypothetical protein